MKYEDREAVPHIFLFSKWHHFGYRFREF